MEQRAGRQVPPAGQQAGVQGLQQAHRHHPHQWQEGEEAVGTYCTGILQCPQPFSSPYLDLAECIPVSDLRGGADGRVQPQHDETLRARRAAHNNTVMKSGSRHPLNLGSSAAVPCLKCLKSDKIDWDVC